MLDTSSQRKLMIAERKQRYTVKSESLMSYESKSMVDNCVKLINFTKAKNVMIYLPLNGEADISGLVSHNIQLFVPVTRGVEIRPAKFSAKTELTVGEYGVRVPRLPEYVSKSIIDLCFVPAVAVDRDKNRIGFGKGCYDRFLADMTCVKAAVCFNFQILEAIKPNPFDIKMDYILTESGYF